MDKDRKILQHISATLDEVLAVMKTKPSLFTRITNTGAAVVGTVAIVTVIDIILKWFFGG